MDPISKRFVGAIERFAAAEQIPLVSFIKGERKDDIAQAMRREFEGDEGVMFIGKAQEKSAVFRTEKTLHPLATRRLQECPDQGVLQGRALSAWRPPSTTHVPSESASDCTTSATAEAPWEDGPVHCDLQATMISRIFP
jgi:hypothetical protein